VNLEEIDATLEGVKDRWDHAGAPYNADMLALIRAAEAMRALLPDSGLPKAWADLLAGLALLAKHPSNDISPLNCTANELTVMADPELFTPEEIDRLDTLGFIDGPTGTFNSFRFGSA
jgi:hypothetical protein